METKEGKGRGGEGREGACVYIQPTHANGGGKEVVWPCVSAVTAYEDHHVC